MAAPERTLPLPRPGDNAAFLAQAAKVRDQLGGIPMVRDDASGWGLPPDRLILSGNVPCRINTLGLRGPELGPLPAGEERLLSLGDSTVFGDGVPESQVFSQVAAELLTKRWQRPVQGVIGGVPGHDSAQSLARLREKGAAIAPTWVIIANLWSDVYKDNGFLRPSAAVEAVRSPLTTLASYRVLRLALAPYLLRQKVGWIASMEGDVGAGGIGGADARSRVLLRDYVIHLRAIAALAGTLGARPAFLALPAPIDLDPAGAPPDILEYRAAMHAVATELDAPFVDGAAWFQAHGGTIGHFADQVHPNAFGHALLGAAVADTLGGTGDP